MWVTGNGSCRNTFSPGECGGDSFCNLVLATFERVSEGVEGVEENFAEIMSYGKAERGEGLGS